jgi:ProP effector
MRRQELHPRTAGLNKTQKNKSKKARNEALLWLAATFPQAFDNTIRIRPLKIGIMKDILLYTDKAEKDKISKSKLREAVVLFTRRIDYLTCLKAREMRIDLNGNAVLDLDGKPVRVTEDEAERAAVKIRKRVEKSSRNARKILPSKGQIQNNLKECSSLGANFLEIAPPHFPERAPAFSVQNAPVSLRPAVVVKHKSSRQYDPDTVARLKEKLGLSRKSSQTTDS